MDKKCKNCGGSFQISEQDLEFLDKVSPVIDGKKLTIPPSNFCPLCKQQMLTAFRNERSLYHRKCDKCGVSIISMFPSSTSCLVYCAKCWWSDGFDPTSYEKDYDFNKPFFEQFAELMKETPLPHMVIGNGENSDYTNYSWQNKNSYLLSSSDYCEDCYYSLYLFRCKDAIDSIFCDDSELIYQCVDCKKCYSSFYLQNCQECTNCSFGFDLRACSNCVGCAGLRRKKYCIFNEQYSPAEYKKKKEEFFGKNKNLDLLRAQFNEFKLKFPHKFAEIENCENCTGDHLMSCKNVENSFDLVESQDAKNTSLGLKAKDCVDCAGVPKSELCYCCFACPEDYGLLFSGPIWPKSSFLTYCLFSRMSKNCFGCVSLRSNEYCILNKQYTKEKYEKLVPKIVESMEKSGEWGEIYPQNICPFSYNETLANDLFPLSKEEALKKGWEWMSNETEKLYKGPKYEIPENINDVSEDICKKILICEETGKPYKIIPQELKFYKKMHLSIPKKCPDARHKERFGLRNPRKLWERKCAKCGDKIFSSYDLNRKEIVYCEKCYGETIY